MTLPTETTDDFLKRFETVIKTLKLREETVDGFDEQSYLRNFIANELSLSLKIEYWRK